MYFLPTLSSLYPKLKKTWIKRFSMRSLTYWGILAIEAASENQEDGLEDGIHLRRLAWDYCCLTWISYFSTHFNRGNPLSFPNIQRWSSASRGGRSPVNRSYAKVQAWLNLKHMTTLYNYIKRSLKQTSNKKVRPHEIQEGDFVPKRVLSFQPDSKGKWTPNYEGSCAIHLQLWMVTNSHVLWKPMQSRNTLSKNEGSISCRS